MRLIPVDMISDGMVLGKAIFTECGQVVLSEGLTLKDSYKKKFKQFGVHEVYIIDEQDKTKMHNDSFK